MTEVQSSEESDKLDLTSEPGVEPGVEPGDLCGCDVVGVEVSKEHDSDGSSSNGYSDNSDNSEDEAEQTELLPSRCEDEEGRTKHQHVLTTVDADQMKVKVKREVLKKRKQLQRPRLRGKMDGTNKHGKRSAKMNRKFTSVSTDILL